MRLVRKDQIDKPFVNTTGERVYEMIGAPVKLGGTVGHSFGHTVIPVGCCSRPHYHPVAEETYYVLSGQGRMVVDGQEFCLVPGDALLIQPPELHQIFNAGDIDLEFLVICAPPWDKDNSVYLD